MPPVAYVPVLLNAALVFIVGRWAHARWGAVSGYWACAVSALAAAGMALSSGLTPGDLLTDPYARLAGTGYAVATIVDTGQLVQLLLPAASSVIVTALIGTELLWFGMSAQTAGGPARLRALYPYRHHLGVAAVALVVLPHLYYPLLDLLLPAASP